MRARMSPPPGSAAWLCAAALLLSCVRVDEGEREKGGAPARAVDAVPPQSGVAAPGGDAAPVPLQSGVAAPGGDAVRPEAPAGDPATASNDLGLRFADPPWFRETMFPGAEVVDRARSAADAHGRFKSHLVFVLAPESSVPGCMEQAHALLAPHVPTLQRNQLENGRERITGANDRYEISIICGTTADGRVRAYVGFEWKA